MRNKPLFLCFLAGFIFIAGIYCQDEEQPVITIPDSVAATDFKAVPPINFDSLLRVIPADTSRVTVERHFKGNLAQKYAGDDELNFSRGNGGKSFLRKIKEWLNNMLRNLLGLDKSYDINKITEYVLDAIYALIFLAVTYIVVRLVMNHKGRWFFEKNNKSVEINLDNVELHIHEADFDSLLREAESKGDTRQSIRLQYLWLLKIFTDKNIIEWNPDKTNADYLREIKDENLQTGFRYLSYLYNYIWYGEFSINDEEYENARKAFQCHLKSDIRHEQNA